MCLSAYSQHSRHCWWSKFFFDFSTRYMFYPYTTCRLSRNCCPSLSVELGLDLCLTSKSSVSPSTPVPSPSRNMFLSLSWLLSVRALHTLPISLLCSVCTTTRTITSAVRPIRIVLVWLDNSLLFLFIRPMDGRYVHPAHRFLYRWYLSSLLGPAPIHE